MTQNQSQINLQSAFTKGTASNPAKADAVLGDTFESLPSQFRITKVAKDAISKSTLGKSALIMGLLALVFFLIPNQDKTAATPADISQDNISVALTTETGTAGQPLILTSTQIQPGALLSASVRTPDGHELDLSARASQSGIAQITLTGSETQVAGIYLVRAHTDNKTSRDTTFQIKPAPADENRSHFTTSKSNLQANGQDQTQITVALRDQFGNAIPDNQLKIISSRTSDILTQSSSQTDQNGEIQATLRSVTSGSAFLTAFDTVSGQVIGQPLEIRFENPLAALNSSQSNLSQLLALLGQTSTPSLNSSYLMTDLASPFATTDVHHFEIEGLPAEIMVGEPIGSLTVRAVDDNGFRVDNYQGTIHFRVDDDSAILPLDTTFNEANAGERSFHLAVTFTKSGLHTLIVEDTLDNGIFGRIDDIQVTGNPGNQTTSPEITSPIDGTTLSTSKIKVAGRATVGSFISIYDGTNKLGEVTADNRGQWLFTTPELFDGTHQLAAIAIAEDSEISPVSESITVVIDSTNPQPATVTLEPDTVSPRGEVLITVQTEQDDLQKAELIIDRRIIELTSNPLEPQIFTGSFIAPKERNSYDLDLILTDDLDNAETYRELATLRVVGEIQTDPIGTALVSVSDVRIIDRGPNYITLAWHQVNSAVRYQIKYGETPDHLDYSQIVTSGITQSTIDGLISGVNYHFAVQAIDESGRSSEITSASQTSGQPQPSDTFAQNDEIATIPGQSETTIPVSEIIPEASSVSDDETIHFENGKKIITKVIKVPRPKDTPDVGPASTLVVLLSISGIVLINLIRKHKQANLLIHTK